MTIDNVSGGQLIDPAWGNSVADRLNDGIYMHAGVVMASLTGATWTKIPLVEVSAAGGLSIASNEVTGFTDGYYAVSVYESGTGSPHRFVIAAKANGSGYPSPPWISDTNNDGYATSGTKLMALTSTDTLPLWVYNRSATQAAEFGLYVFRVGG